MRVSGFTSAQTRIPEVPDQTEFLDRWYEFHQGFRVVRNEDGSEERVAVLGEDFREVSPGVLPRTLEELRAGQARSELEQRELRDAQQRLAAQRNVVEETGPSLDDALEQMFQEAQNEETQAEPQQPTRTRLRTTLRPHATPTTEETGSAPTSSIHAQAMNPASSRNREYQARRVAALRRELHRMRNGIERVISGLRDLGETVPDHEEATNRLSELGQTLDDIDQRPSQSSADRAMQSVAALADGVRNTTQADRSLAALQARVDAARFQIDEARRHREQAAAELDRADRELRGSESRYRQLHAEQRTTENYIRLFGTREEMVAQGEQYQSPIGGMFDRADERFQRAEEARQQERVLIRVLEDQEARGEQLSDEVLNHLFEIQAREVDVWGVPRPRTQAPVPGPEEFRVPNIPANQGRFGTPQTDMDPRGEEASMDSLYATLRRQNWSQQPTVTAEQPVVRDTSEANGSHARTDNPTENPAGAPGESEAQSNPAPSIVGGPPGHQLDSDPETNNDRGLDAAFVLAALSSDETLRARVHGEPSAEFIAALRGRLESNALTWVDGENIESYLGNADIVWEVQLPAERNRRRRARGEEVTFVADALEITNGREQTIHHIEIMAECFQMSARVRQVSGQNAPDQLRMLYRLQRGLRNAPDRAVLQRMLEDRETLRLAMELHPQQAGNRSRSDDIRTRIELMRQRLLESQRRAAARLGDHTRAELNAQRQAAETVAVAAGRIAMRDGPQLLLQRMAARSEETRIAYERLRSLQNASLGGADSFITRRATLHDFNASPSATDSEPDSDDERQGLDAKDTGRPDEPMTDEEMTMKLDCRVCYSQLADVACLPCGHLSMCQWCSDQHSPTMPHDRTRPRRAAACPVCRKGIRQKVKIFRA